jgi:A/G-specific adenine glycosylase
MSRPPSLSFSERLLTWWDTDGRKDLPWQRDPTPYRVWVSEIMLQQTQVTTVVSYYQRFMARFPDLASLAAAPVDTVLHHWSGLGYYARARNLHKAAQLICERYDGEFPLDIAAVMQLPGIGRSTAGAILALAARQMHPILDGNVKRVLTRYHAIEGWPGNKDIENALWQLAQRHTPARRTAHYTQAIMDLGATLCTRSQPRCGSCPVQNDCLAFSQNRQKEFPSPKPRGTLPVRSTQLLMVRNPAAAILLVKRPPSGIWGGLWSLPECPAEDDIVSWCRQQMGCVVREEARWPSLRHSFSHFHLDIHPVLLRLEDNTSSVMEDAGALWYNLGAPQTLGLAAPVKRLLNQLVDTRR